MLSNPILYRVLTNPFLYQWLLATALPFLLWAELAKIARRDPGIWPHVLPWLKILAVGLWFSSAAWGFYTLSAPQGKVFYEINAILITLSGGTQLVYGWLDSVLIPEPMLRNETAGGQRRESHKKLLPAKTSEVRIDS